MAKPIIDAAVMLTVRPPPTSTIYSSKIAGELKSFGRLNHFSISSNTEESRTYRALFESSEAAKKAIAASPFSVEAYHNLPTAKSLDPFNVLGLQQRKQPEARTFECEAKLSGKRHDVRGEKRSSESRTLVVDERSGPLYRSLLEAEAPMNLLDGLSSTIEKGTPNGRSGLRGMKAELLKLDNMYRKGSTDAKSEDLPPIRKHLTGGLVQRKLS